MKRKWRYSLDKDFTVPQWVDDLLFLWSVSDDDDDNNNNDNDGNSKSFN